MCWLAGRTYKGEKICLLLRDIVAFKVKFHVTCQIIHLQTDSQIHWLRTVWDEMVRTTLPSANFFEDFFSVYLICFFIRI